MKLKIPAQLKSRKFWFAIIAAVIAFGNAYWKWNLSTEEIFQIILPLLAFIGVEGIGDAVGRLK